MRNYFLTLLLAAILCVPFSMSAQVTIGSGDAPRSFSVLELFSDGERGLRLPKMTTTERNDMTTEFLAGDYYELANGLVIFNTTNGCLEYWNGTRWVSLCEGNSQMVIGPDPCLDVPADGDGCDYRFEITDPDCEYGPFFFMIVAGSDFAYFAYTNPDGFFRISFTPNNSMYPRSAIVRVTSDCTGLSRDFLFIQSGQDCDGQGNAPQITASNTELCAGGAVYLSIPAATPNLSELIWTRNGMEIARGVNHLVVTQPGRYNLYSGFIGCGAHYSGGVLVEMGSTPAPAPVGIISAVNNGFVCNASETVRIVASEVAGGTIVWYHNGVRTNQTGTSIQAGIGDWFAVVESGGCSSTPSNVIHVRLHPEAGTSVPAFSIRVNGVPVGGDVEICLGGALHLSIDNPTAGVTYTWFAGDQASGAYLGTGTTVSTTVAVVGNFPLIQAIGSRAGYCSRAVFTQFTVSTVDNAPSTPVITSNTAQTMCGTSTVLTASSTGAVSFIWYRDGVLLPGNTSSITVTAVGNHWVYGVSSAGCLSLRSAGFEITRALGFPENLRIYGNSSPNAGIQSYIAAMYNSYGATFTWTVTPPHTIISGQGTANVSINITNDPDPFIISVVGRNDCGYATPNPYELHIVPQGACAVVITSHSPSSRALTMVRGYNPNLSVVVNYTGSSVSYQWYRATVSGGVGVPVGTNSPILTGETGLSESTYFFYVVVTTTCLGGGTATAVSQQFTVTVVDLENIGPGAGTIVGRSCFDIARTTCLGLIPARRYSQRTNFADPSIQTIHSAPPFSGVQTYTFTASGNFVSNVRYIIHDPDGVINQSMTPLSGELVGGALANGSSVDLLVHFRNNLNTTLQGRGRDASAYVTIHIIFFDSSLGADRRVFHRLRLRDCICCGAFMGPNRTDWREFMCHNLGAVETLNPFVAHQDLHGRMFKWGVRQFALEADLNILHAGGNPFPDGMNWANRGGHPPVGFGVNWDMTSHTSDHGNPCPPGWRVPTRQEWLDVINQSHNPARRVSGALLWNDNVANFYSGIHLGNYLFLPNAGSRNMVSGALNFRGHQAHYWSSDSAPGSATDTWSLVFNGSTVLMTNGWCRTSGMPIRCIVDLP